MNEFGGKWTEEKIEIFMKYVMAYLTIMKKYPFFRLLYFDGFAGSGIIDPNDENGETDEFDLIQGVATRILDISEPRPFDIHYFVEKNKENAERLHKIINDTYPFKRRTAFVANDDCNKKLIDLAAYMRRPENKNVKALAFLDPYGMQLNWNSLLSLRELAIDAWILVPTGIGPGRLLRNDALIDPSWMKKLKEFFGMEEEAIMEYFYQRKNVNSLFGELISFEKKPQPSEQIAALYSRRILEEGIFKHVSTPRPMKNSINMTMYHFIMCTNNPAALNIANTIKT